MKRFAALLLALILICSAAAAETESLILTGTVEAAHTTVLKAPASGELAPFTVRAGDVLSRGETVFSIEPVKVYAPVDGTVAGVFIQAGSIADAAVSRYGAAMYLDYAQRYEISASMRTGYDHADNRDLRVGMPVYVRSVNEKHFADGFITNVSGTSFTVAVQGGDLVYNQDVKIYRTADYEHESLLARSELSTVAPYAISASGTVTDVAVSYGDAVKAGSYLFSYVPDELEPALRAKKDALWAKAAEDWVVQTVQVENGAKVQKDQVLLTAVRAGDYELVAQAAEDEVSRIAVGDGFTAHFEELDTEPVEAVVSAISPLGTNNGEETTYAVYLDFAVPQGVWIGMHATLEK